MRTPKEIWQRPRYDVLIGQRYKQDEPPFDPFPTVTNIVNAAFCPVAALHELLHGYGNATVPSNGFAVGALFHNFIAYLKTADRNDIEPIDLSNLMFKFEDYARNEEETTVRACELYVEPWLERKIEILRNIKSQGDSCFNVSVANSYIPFSVGDKLHSYPLYGQIDEIDFVNRRIIERTIKGDPADDVPPSLKDLQIWLLWKTLRAVKKDEYPVSWREINFDEFDLVVETPYKDFLVPRENPEFEKQTVEAYSWISDIAQESKAVAEAWRSRSCSFKNKKTCGLSWSCYGKAREHPTSRSEMHERVKIFYRPLLWEQMWEHHLLRYQLTMLTESVQRRCLKGQVSIGRVISENNGNLTLEIEGNFSPAIERRVEGENECTIIFGTFKLCLERQASIRDVNPAKKELTVKLQDTGKSPNGQVKVLFPQMSIISEGPWFLKRTNQQELHKLEKWGFDDPEKARNHSVIRMMECVFGEDVLKMEDANGENI